MADGEIKYMIVDISAPQAGKVNLVVEAIKYDPRGEHVMRFAINDVEIKLVSARLSGRMTACDLTATAVLISGSEKFI